MGELLRALRKHTSLPQTALAHMAGMTQGTVSKLLSGHTRYQHQGRIDAALSGLGARVGQREPQRCSPTVIDHDEFPGTPVEAVRHAQILWRRDLGGSSHTNLSPLSSEQLTTASLRWLIDRPSPIPEARAADGREVSHAHVDAIERTCDMFTALDHEFGGGHARTAAVQYLHSEVGPLLRGNYAPDTGRRLYAASARLTAKVGATGYDAGLHALARHYFMQSMALAHAAGDRAMGAKALALLSHQANLLGEAHSAVDLARTAQAGTADSATPAVRAMLAAMEARGRATLGDASGATRALHEMEQAFHHIGPEDPSWMGYFDGSEVADEFAHCFHDLGYGATAIDHAQLSVKLAPESLRRSRTFAALVSASAHLRMACPDPEAACALARAAITDAGHLRSARVRAYITRLRSDLAPYASSRHVREFDEFLSEAPVAQA
ncbi:regulator [Nocardiopsis sp. HNM0947]|uniref:Regulator n=1 Tax=Nocardiopsis coralli TaxID=2772213 RepID=A0ABR9P047_9ACTN|nr:helix-turn-helix domain-containing protein [Nocardiopsis coralli]MBE2997197.1 regulator [Nocardiopsis coralli]